MNLVQMNEEILLKFLQEEWRSQVNEPLSEVTLEEYAEYEELLQGLTSPNTEVSPSRKNGQKKAAKSGMKRKHTRTRKIRLYSGWIRHAQRR